MIPLRQVELNSMQIATWIRSGAERQQSSAARRRANEARRKEADAEGVGERERAKETETARRAEELRQVAISKCAEDARRISFDLERATLSLKDARAKNDIVPALHVRWLRVDSSAVNESVIASLNAVVTAEQEVANQLASLSRTVIELREGLTAPGKQSCFEAKPEAQS